MAKKYQKGIALMYAFGVGMSISLIFVGVYKVILRFCEWLVTI